MLPDHPARLSRALARWFAQAQRALPWRQERTPYRVWLSEIMLQQTRVAVVIDYYRRFTERWPTVEALAAAPIDDVLAAWSGLGYYARGRNLHAAARAVVAAGGFPRSAAALQALPGVGPYTAAAVASLAFGEAVAVLDGNVARVLARLCDDATPIDTPASQRLGRRRAQALVEVAVDGGPAVINEALMELGALLCTPQTPSCHACPWAAACRGRAAGTAASLPKKRRAQPRRVLEVACVVARDASGAVWLRRRPGRGLFGGLWEPPSREVAGAAELPAAWGAIAAEQGLSVPSVWPAPVVIERTLTHRLVRFHAAALSVPARAPADAATGRWVTDVASVGTSSAVRALLAAVAVIDASPGSAGRAHAAR